MNENVWSLWPSCGYYLCRRVFLLFEQQQVALLTEQEGAEREVAWRTLARVCCLLKGSVRG